MTARSMRWTVDWSEGGQERSELCADDAEMGRVLQEVQRTVDPYAKANRHEEWLTATELFELVAGGPRFAGWLHPDGRPDSPWTTPLFDREEADRIADWITNEWPGYSLSYDLDRDVYVYRTPHAVAEQPSVEYEGLRLYAIGTWDWSWTWVGSLGGNR
jgi:hypothetical protein